MSERARQGEALELARRFYPEELDMVEFVRSGGTLGWESDVPIAPDFEVEFLPRVLGSELGGSGLPGMVEGWREWLEPYDSYIIRAQGFEELTPEEIMVVTRVEARTHRDGVIVEHTPASVATFRDGTLVRLRFFLEADAARSEAADGSG